MRLTGKQLEQLRNVEREPEVRMCMHDIMCAIPMDLAISEQPVFKIRALGHMVLMDDDFTEDTPQDHRLIVVEMCMDETRLSAIIAELSSAHYAHLSNPTNEG